MKKKVEDILFLVKLKQITIPHGVNLILSLMGENTEDVSTSDISESDDLHDVSDRNAERSDNPDSSEEVVEGALAKRTDDGNKPYCKNDSLGNGRCLAVSRCIECGHRLMKSS